MGHGDLKHACKLTHQVEVFWSGDRDVDHATYVWILCTSIPAAGAVGTGTAAGGVHAFDLPAQLNGDC